jgi:hypothetical protein
LLSGAARQASNTDAKYRACQIRLRAERKVRQLLREMEKAKGGGGGDLVRHLRINKQFSTKAVTPERAAEERGV